MRAIAICVLVFSCVATPAPVAAERAQVEDVRTSNVKQKLKLHMEREVNERRFRGAVLVTQNGQTLLANGYGFANEEWQATNTLHTTFRIGSLTKQFTATLIMQLREKDSLELEDSICRYLQPCPAAWRPVTLHHLLSHSSGIDGYPKQATEPSQSQSPPWTAEQITAAFGNQALNFTPGARWEYSDWGYSLLGLVIAKVTGMSYEQALRTQILEPLGMDDTGLDHTEMILKQRAAGYRLVENKIIHSKDDDVRGAYSAGAMYSTVADLYKWDQALYSEIILPRQALDLMWTDHLANTGYGWFVSASSAGSKSAWWAVPGKLELAHTGAISGFTAEILRFPQDHTTVIVLSNVENAGIIAPFLAAIVFGQEFKLPKD